MRTGALPRSGEVPPPLDIQLDSVSRAANRAEARQSAADLLARDGQQRRIVRWIGVQLMLALMVLFFMPLPGNDALTSGSDGAGSASFRLIVFGIAAVAIMAVIERPSLAFALLKRLWPMLLLLGWILLTSRWASHPDISIRRSFACMLMFIIAVSLAVSFDHATELHRPYIQALSAVLIVNWISAHSSAQVDPALAVNGIYSQKNSAGALALYVIVAANSAILLYSRWYLKLSSAGVLLLAWSFLITTQAKTSIATAALLSIAMPFMAGAFAQAKANKVLAGSLLAFVLGSALFVQYALGITWEQIGRAIFTDLTFTDRTYIWGALYPEIARHPWTGAGFGSFWATGELVNPITSAPGDAVFMSPDVINEAHNGYIDITLQAGYVGLILTGLVILRAMWAAGSVIATRSGGRRDRVACTMLLCVLIAQASANCMESQIFSPSNPIGYMFIVMAVQAERWRLGLRDRPRARPPSHAHQPTSQNWTACASSGRPQARSQAP